MVEQVMENVDVIASFSGGKIRPRAFLWRKRKYTIESVNLAYLGRDGRDPIYYFAVSDGANAFKLSFRPSSMIWKLMEIYAEG